MKEEMRNLFDRCGMCTSAIVEVVMQVLLAGGKYTKKITDADIKALLKTG